MASDALKSKRGAKIAVASPSQNAFVGQSEPPSQTALQSALGKSFLLWKRLLLELTQEVALRGSWHSSSLKHGWAFRLQRDERNIVYLAPRTGSFVASFVLGGKAIAAVRKSGLPPHLLDIIGKTKPYAEGTPVRIEVTDLRDLSTVKILARIKIAN